MPLEFTLDKEVASVPLGTVWEATERESGRGLLIKRIPMKAIGWGRNGWASMLDEIRELSRIQHPALAPVLEVREEGEELLSIGWKPEGRSLEVIAEAAEGLNAEQIRQWVIPVLEALAVAHDRQVIHRHVHERLIFIDSDQKPRIRGFGLSLTRVIETESIPPELLNGGRASVASDQYLSGAMLRRVSSGDLLESPIRVVLDKAMSEKPSGRFGDMLDFMDALLAVLPETATALKAHPRITSAFRIPSARPLRPGLNREIPNVDRAEPAPAPLDLEREDSPVGFRVSVTPVPVATDLVDPGEASESPGPDQDLHYRPSKSKKWLSPALLSAAALLMLIGGVTFTFLRGGDRDMRQGRKVVSPRLSALDRIRVQLEAGRVEDAKDRLDHLIHRGSPGEKLEAMELLGTLRLQEQAPAEAALLFQRVLGETSSEQLYYKLALAEAAQGLDADAVRSLDEGLRLFPDSQRLLEAKRQLGGV